MNYEKRPVLPVPCTTCGDEVSTVLAYQGKNGRRYCGPECHSADPRRDEPPVPAPVAAPRPDVPEHHRPISVGALVRGWGSL